MQNSNIVSIIKKRRSIRSYLLDPIPEQDLYEMLSAGLYAPSGKNRQPWRFLIVKDKNKIKQISKSSIYSRFIRNAPVLVLVYVTPSTDYLIEKDIFGVGACVQNILLAATEKGYGTCVIGELYSAEIEILDSKLYDYKLICGISIGKSKDKPQSVKTKELELFLVECE